MKDLFGKPRAKDSSLRVAAFRMTQQLAKFQFDVLAVLFVHIKISLIRNPKSDEGIIFILTDAHQYDR